MVEVISFAIIKIWSFGVPILGNNSYYSLMDKGKIQFLFILLKIIIQRYEDNF
jgi:hypothetical protein